MDSCLQVTVTKISANIQTNIYQQCTHQEYELIPLIVDEGYLIIDFNGVQQYMYVNKEENAKRILS